MVHHCPELFSEANIRMGTDNPQWALTALAMYNLEGGTPMKRKFSERLNIGKGGG